MTASLSTGKQPYKTAKRRYTYADSCKASLRNGFDLNNCLPKATKERKQIKNIR
ncbi:MAG: hypothetical protein WBH71_06360 [Bacteroidales bacterium]|nr:hypothetical protein [Bacteroidales bacterium]